MNTPSELNEFMAMNLGEFKPFAYFDKHMDCIRVLIQDVSVTEERLSKFFTIAKPNNSPFSGYRVGFTIKGVAHLFNRAGIPLSGVKSLVDILDEIVKELPHAAVKQVSEEFSSVLRANKLEINFDEVQGEELMAA